MTTSDNIQVAIRLRPLVGEKAKLRWGTQGNQIYQIDDNGQPGEPAFTFDHIFDTRKTNFEIYDEIVKDFVECSLKGINATIFTYGQTSSGKTYTMLGDDFNLGIVPLTIQNIFDSVERSPNRKFLLRVSYIEIYNEKINDLLNPGTKDTKICQSISGGVTLKDVKEEIVSTPEEVQDCLTIGSHNKQMGSTDANYKSSRSHTIFKIVIESTENEQGSVMQVSSLNLVDLAGSERVSQTRATGARLKEGGHINKSLSSLGLVIRQLSDGNDFVSFRDSKLTRLLQDSLGGNSKTLIIATITPTSVETTSSTLLFAQRAKAVSNKPKINEIRRDSGHTSLHYEDLSKQLQGRVEELLNQMNDVVTDNENLKRSHEEHQRELVRVQAQKRMLEMFQHGGSRAKHESVALRRHTLASVKTSRVRPSFNINDLAQDAEVFEFKGPLAGEQSGVEEKRRTSYLSTISEEDTTIRSFETPKTQTPIERLRARFDCLQREYDELVTFTKEEKTLSEPLENRIAELEAQVDQLQQQDSTGELRSDLEQIKVSLCYLERVLQETPSTEDETTVIMARLSEKMQALRNIIEEEIRKQIDGFKNFPRTNSLSIPNELTSFRELLTELEAFKDDCSVVISKEKQDDFNGLKLLFQVYEALLHKNELLCYARASMGEEKDDDGSVLAGDYSFSNANESTFPCSTQTPLSPVLEEPLEQTLAVEIKQAEDEMLQDLINEQKKSLAEKDAIIEQQSIRIQELSEQISKLDLRRSEDEIALKALEMKLLTSSASDQKLLERKEALIQDLNKAILSKDRFVHAMQKSVALTRDQIKVHTERFHEIEEKLEEKNAKITELEFALRSAQKNGLESESAGLKCRELERFVIWFLNYIIKERQTVTAKKHSAEERGQFKNVFKLLTENNSHLKTYQERIHDDTFNTEDLIKIVTEGGTIVKEITKIEKSMLQEKVQQLEIMNNSYVEEILNLKKFLDCPKCHQLQALNENLTQDVNSQAQEIQALKSKHKEYSECPKCYQLQRLSDNLRKQLQNQVEEIEKLQAQKRELVDDVSRARMDYYHEREKRINPHPVDVLDDIQVLYNAQMAQELKEANRKEVEVQCTISEEQIVTDYNALQDKYKLMKHYCWKRNEEIKELKATLANTKRGSN